ncbi:MAG: hypothetical protein U5O39_12090 [Gammaproteobacteria bacterium]|nr:hypothetical protein [Gammaproteobacteria bacterium]
MSIEFKAECLRLVYFEVRASEAAKIAGRAQGLGVLDRHVELDHGGATDAPDIRDIDVELKAIVAAFHVQIVQIELGIAEAEAEREGWLETVGVDIPVALKERMLDV